MDAPLSRHPVTQPIPSGRKKKVYVKPTNTGLLLHYQSHVDNRYKRGLLTTMLDRAHRLSSSWAYDDTLTIEVPTTPY